MGGRGSNFGGGGGGTSGGNLDIQNTTSLISERERQRTEVDQTLRVLRTVEGMYGVIIEDAQIATLGGSGASTMAYYDSQGNLAVNKTYFDAAKMNSTYDDCVESGFHPPRGNKTGLEAVVAHEMGHRLTDMAAQRAGMGAWTGIDPVCNDIVARAARRRGVSHGELRSSISGYATQNNAECVAEAFADVYCNGSRANRSSLAIVDELNRYFGR